MAIKTTTVSVTGTLDSILNNDGYYYTPEITQSFNKGKILSVEPVDKDGVVISHDDNSYTVKLRSDSYTTEARDFSKQYSDSFSIDRSYGSFNSNYASYIKPTPITGTVNVEVNTVKIYKEDGGSIELLDNNAPYVVVHQSRNNYDTEEKKLYVFVYVDSYGYQHIDLYMRYFATYNLLVEFTITVTARYASYERTKDFLIEYYDGETQTYTVTFVSNGGSKVAPQTVAEGDKVVSPEITRLGYNLVGWYTDSELNNKYNFNSPVYDDLTLYARWEEKSPGSHYYPDEPAVPYAAQCVFTLWNGKEVDFTSALNMPIVYNSVLDETLDTAQIKLTDLRVKDYPDIDVSTAFEPNTLVTIKFMDEKGNAQNTEINMIISHDDCRMQRKDNTKWRSYQHTVQLVELTKKLERLSVDTLTFTNPIPRNYDATANAVWNLVEE